MESNKGAEEIRSLLLKTVLPLAFPLAGSFISDLITKRANRCSSYTGTTSDCSVQFDRSYDDGSTCSALEEEEEQEMAQSTRRTSRKLAQQSENASSTAGRILISEFSRQGSNAEELMAAAQQVGENPPAEVAVHQVRRQGGDLKTADDDELAALKRLVCGLEERACSMEAQFHDYCEMKEQESAYQKMQIMCLGMKLELLESQSQRLEAAAAEIRAAAEEFAGVRGRLERLQSKVKRMTRQRKQDSDAVGGRILALDAEQDRMARRCKEVAQGMEEVKLLTLQLQEQQQKGAANNDECVEVAVERSLRKLSSSGRDLVDGLEALRDRWAADMEEMIYLGWITAWLQHDLLLCDGEFGGTVVVDDGGDPPEEEERHNKTPKGQTMVAEVAPSTEVQLCKAASASSSSASSSGLPPRRSVDAEREPSCMGFKAAGGGIGRPRLLRKLRGWAGGKGPKRPCRIVGPCCQK